MGIKNFFICIIVFSINLSGFSSNDYLKKLSFYNLENSIMKETEFKENGVKLQYNIQAHKEDELNRIIKLMNNKYYIKNIKDKYHFYLEGTNVIEIKIWEENNITFVEGFIINKDKNISTKYLKEELDGILSNKSNNKKYFKYYKGIITNADKLDINNFELKEESLKVQNGYVGKGILENREKFSYAIMKYNTETQIIIGTPVIFTTY
ncbi:hypothetical protein [Clostridium sp. Ade.TY]|uniref:hypothetical protein n=1 Tax=Clostridium sp. Ade.TY TaxID=1391647 RepID=UPI000409ADD7|nr:hypothetical protein [Clostridium sp. Ade.TY]